MERGLPPDGYEQHRGHNTWTCRCGQEIYRHAGEFVGELACVNRNYGQQF